MLPDIIRLTERSTVVWTLQNNLHPCTFWAEMKMAERTPIFNDVAMRAFRNTKVKIWRSYFQLFDYLGSDGDQQHMGEATMAKEVQIILNFLCNEVVESSCEFCCVKSPKLLPESLIMI
jgi:hypothetical protein